MAIFPNSSHDAATTTKVCKFWRQGRCNRPHCPFLHREAPLPPHKQNLVWRGPQPNKTVRGPPPTPPKSVKKKQQQGIVDATAAPPLDSFPLLAPLQGHSKAITGIALPSGSDKLYSGSLDHTIRVWDCGTGGCVQQVDLGSQVGCLICQGPWMFAGITNVVKAWNTQTATEFTLDGPVGQVCALESDIENKGMLFAGTEDGNVLVWKLNVEGNHFEPAALFTGHQQSVVSLIVGAGRLYTGSKDKTIRVWDLTTSQCIQTLTGHTSAVISLLCWDAFLISCSIDQTIKVWATLESGKIEVIHTRKEEHGLLALSGVHDAQAKPVLFCSCSDNCIRLYDLPSFNERGKILAEKEVRAIHIGPNGLIFTGDGAGELKVWKWSSDKAT